MKKYIVEFDTTFTIADLENIGEPKVEEAEKV